MASFNIHLAIAKRYIFKNQVSNIDDFYRGTIEPDLKEYENKLHYTDVNRNRNDILSYLKGKTNLSRFLSENDINNDYNKGVFLHLITDYLFFNDFFDIKYIRNITYEDFVKDLHFSYYYTNSYIKNKYNISYGIYEDEINKNISNDKKEKNTLDNIGNNVLEFEKLYSFIERVSDINLEHYKDKILNNLIYN